jgi:hypothetical protein
MISQVAFILGVSVQLAAQVDCVLIEECQSRISYVVEDKMPIDEHIYFNPVPAVKRTNGMYATTDSC